MKDTHDLYPLIGYNAIKNDVLVDLESINARPEVFIFPTEQHRISSQFAARGDQYCPPAAPTTYPPYSSKCWRGLRPLCG